MTKTVSRSALAQVIEAVYGDDGARRAVKYLSPTLTVTATRRHRSSKRDWRREILLTVGRPNYAARQHIKACQRAGEPFPVKRVHLTRWPVKAKKG